MIVVVLLKESITTFVMLCTEWSPIIPQYTTSVEGKIATKTGKAKIVLLSSAKQFGPDHSIEFTVSITSCGSINGKF